MDVQQAASRTSALAGESVTRDQEEMIAADVPAPNGD
jgi:hypothetical protein